MLFAPETPVKPETIFALHEARKGYIRFLPEGGVELDLRSKKWDQLYKEIKGTMKELAM
jgi:hypothetical protein